MDDITISVGQVLVCSFLIVARMGRDKFLKLFAQHCDGNVVNGTFSQNVKFFGGLLKACSNIQ